MLDYRAALSLAQRDFSQRDPGEMAANAGADFFETRSTLAFDFLDWWAEVEYPSGAVHLYQGEPAIKPPIENECTITDSSDAPAKSTPAPDVAHALTSPESSTPSTTATIKNLNPQQVASADDATQIILLHYLTRADGHSLADRWVAFQQLPGGFIYTGPYHKRTKSILLRTFGDDPEGLRQAGLAMGADLLDVGHVGLKIQALPRVPVGLGLWAGDHEVPSSATIVYDACATHYLHLEDLIFLTTKAILRLCALGE